MSTPIRTLGSFVRERREGLGLNLTEFAKVAELSKSELSALENGKIGLPGAEKRRRLAKALGVSHVDILVAAGELLADEVRASGIEGVVAVDPSRQALIDRLMRIALRDDRYDLLESILDRYIRLDRKASEAVEHPADESHHGRIVRTK